PLLLASCLAVALILLVGPTALDDLSIPALGGALALAAVGPLIVPDLGAARPVGRALASAAALVLGALGLAVLPVTRAYIYGTTPLDNDEALASAALACLVAVVVTILVQHLARRLFPRIGSWLWIPALLLALAGTYGR